MNPSSTDIRIYAITMAYTDPVTSQTVSTRFLVDVIKTPPIIGPTISINCASDIWPMTLGGLTDVHVSSFDTDPTSES